MQQYIDFFKSERQTIDHACPPLLNAFREKAGETFQQKGFPAYRSEDYQQTDMAGLLKGNFGFYLNPPGQNIDPYKVFYCNVPHLNTHKCFTINGHFYGEPTGADLPAGVFSGSLNTFARQHPAIFADYYNRLAAEKGDGLAAFNTMFVQDGYVLYVPANTVIEKAVQLTNISRGNNASLINRRILVIMEQGAQAKLLVCDHTADEESTLAATQVVEIYAGENASFDFYELEESTPKTIRLTTNFIRQEASSCVVVNTITLSNGVTRNNYRVDLTGKQAETHLYGMAIGDMKQQIDNFTLINHHVPACHSDELFKYVLDDEATGTFGGRIIVAKDAPQTKAYQNNRNLLGSRHCRMYSKPQLEIYADDVKCSHGMTIGQLDENALFYMRSRGIPADEAILLLKFAFTGDVIQGIRLEGLRDRLKLLIEKRFRGELIKCQGCI
ncbi:MAG: Fe-S cluster assembly protein SufD [Dysgonamonadaceae bacterium]|jgi:Fe-S cluster assembly protein SufD|nr:Fe-S cluster assembly protein SufD [Dysgonamonadaceae bacterium]